MWILNFLPDWLFHAIFLIGVLGLAITYLIKLVPIPMVYVYKTPIQLVSIALIIFGTFMSGAVFNQNSWLEKVAKLEKDVEEAKLKAEKVNTETITQYVTKTKIIREKGDEVIKYIDREVIKIDERCTVTPEAVKAHNEAAKDRLNLKLDSTLTSVK
jgi:hypothetical protein